MVGLKKVNLMTDGLFALSVQLILTSRHQGNLTAKVHYFIHQGHKLHKIFLVKSLIVLSKKNQL
jgi:hypothetical protein